MTNPAEVEEKKKNQTGLALRLIGSLLAVLALVNVILQTSNPNTEVGAAPWFGILVGLALVVIGYLQKIAANK